MNIYTTSSAEYYLVSARPSSPSSSNTSLRPHFSRLAAHSEGTHRACGLGCGLGCTKLSEAPLASSISISFTLADRAVAQSRTLLPFAELASRDESSEGILEWSTSTVRAKALDGCSDGVREPAKDAPPSWLGEAGGYGDGSGDGTTSNSSPLEVFGFGDGVGAGGGAILGPRRENAAKVVERNRPAKAKVKPVQLRNIGLIFSRGVWKRTTVCRGTVSAYWRERVVQV